MNIGITQDYVAQFHSAAASGDTSKLSAMLKGAGLTGNVNITNDKGWTALMFAARNGHKDIVKVLLENGCDTSSLSESGQTALDIAKFWNFQEVVGLLEPSQQPGNLPRLQETPQETVNFFNSSLLDRAAHFRKKDDWIQEALTNPLTKYVIFSDLRPLVTSQTDSDDPLVPNIKRLCTLSYKHVASHLKDVTYVFLGLEKSQDQEVPWFALDLSSLKEEQLTSLKSGAQLVSPVPSAMQLPAEEAGVFAEGRSILAWHERYGFCPTCGSTTRVEEAGHKRVCSNSDCKSLKGIHNTSYPRVDPSVIMAISSTDRQRLLLGRGKHFPPGMFSCLAGFVEPGESIEDACRREAEEESGVKIGGVEYHSCQPWPMPCSLMIGCLAQAKSDFVKVDKDELEQARWFSRQEVVQMLNRNHPDKIYVPPAQAIAHTLIKVWLGRSHSNQAANL